MNANTERTIIPAVKPTLEEELSPPTLPGVGGVTD